MTDFNLHTLPGMVAMSSKLVTIALATTLFASSIAFNVNARTCENTCPAPVLQFTPGQRIKVQVLNRTENRVEIEKVAGTQPLSISPGQQIEFERDSSTNPNLSVVFWDITSLAIKSSLSKPNPNTLRIELKSERNYPPGDRSVYIHNDGRVEVF